MTAETRVALLDSGPDRLDLEIDGQKTAVKADFGELSRRLVGTLPDELHDLLDISLVVYAANRIVSRGGRTDPEIGLRWRRRFLCVLPVRRPDLWTQDGVRSALESLLGFLSEDSWQFDFTEGRFEGPRQAIFDYGNDAEFETDRVIPFSGGLDSLSGAADALLARNERVVLVSHTSSTKIAPVQRAW
ncbi:MAG: hypothetical protein AAGF94_18385 [Pseudomonadota bacterium]